MDLADLHALLGAHPPVLDAPVDGPPLVGALLPGPDFVDRAWGASERSPAWLRSFQALFDAGRLGGTGHLCLLSAGNGEPEAVAALAQEGGCSALIATEHVLATVARRYAHRVPLLVDIGDPDAVDVADGVADPDGDALEVEDAEDDADAEEDAVADGVELLVMVDLE